MAWSLQIRAGRLGAAALGAWLAAAPSPASAEGWPPPPLAFREPSPVARLFLQPPFEAPEVLEPGRLDLGIRLTYSNSLLSAQNEQLKLDVKVETAQPTLWLRYGVLPRVEVQLAIPVVDDHGGFLDAPINGVEAMFGAWNDQRRAAARDAAYYRLTRPDGRGVVQRGGAGLGDMWGALKVQLLGEDGGGGSLAVRGELKLPTGRLPYGSQEVDVGGSLLAGWSWASRAVRLQVDALFPTARVRELDLHTRPYGAVQLGITQRMGQRVALHAQASAHLSPITGTGLDQLDAFTAYVLGGATFALGRAAWLEAAVVENVFSPDRGADITFLVGLHSVR